MSLTDLAMALAPAGWPRPLSVQRYEQPGRLGARRVPVPWNADSMGNLGAVHMDRQGETGRGTVCQTCGDLLGETAYLIVGRSWHSYEDGRFRVDALDDGLLHERCLRLSLSCCPHLMADEHLCIDRVPTGRGVEFIADEVEDVTRKFIP